MSAFESHADDARREQRLRRVARRQGLVLQKSRRQHAGGPYFIVDPYRNILESSEWGMDLDAVEVYLDDA
jgi:G:T-mismatch repair DNA endonuclease (very short patch repair protein)